LGVSALDFFRAEKGEANLCPEHPLASGEWRRHLLAGAAQAFDTRLPDVTHGKSLDEILASCPPPPRRGSRWTTTRPPARYPSFTQYVKLPGWWFLRWPWRLGRNAGGPARSAAFCGPMDLSWRIWELACCAPRTACVAAIAMIKGRLGLM